MKNTTFRILLAVELAWLCGGGMACLLLPAAMAERGYMAIGGEWLLIGAAAALGWSLGRSLGKDNKKARR